mmetsp:Transcript_61810/g.182481  ORF Transcript_61810/g.182481 Transcript_61810/m.182481 type:complete len:168 (+) Transcript_61810:71-574(+)
MNSESATSAPRKRRTCSEGSAQGDDSKRQKHVPANASADKAEDRSLLRDLPRDCWVRLLEYIAGEDLANVSLVSHECREVCRSPTLDQNRVATVVCTEDNPFFYQSNTVTLLLTIRRASMEGVFGEQYTTLRIDRASLLAKTTNKKISAPPSRMENPARNDIGHLSS